MSHRRVDAVMALHHPTEDDAYPPECWDGDCEHGIAECPLVKILVCAECALLANHGGEAWDDVIPAEVLWPCATARAVGVSAIVKAARKRG